MQGQPSRILTSILTQVPHEFQRVDLSIVTRFDSALPHANVDHRNEISFFIASLVCSVPDSLLFGDIVIARR
jgi:hypothetical protein